MVATIPVRGSDRCRSLILSKNASSLSEISYSPAGFVVPFAFGTGPPHVGVQNVGCLNVIDAVPVVRAPRYLRGHIRLPSGKERHSLDGGSRFWPNSPLGGRYLLFQPANLRVSCLHPGLCNSDRFRWPAAATIQPKATCQNLYAKMLGISTSKTAPDAPATELEYNAACLNGRRLRRIRALESLQGGGHGPMDRECWRRARVTPLGVDLDFIAAHAQQQSSGMIEHVDYLTSLRVRHGEASALSQRNVSPGHRMFEVFNRKS